MSAHKAVLWFLQIDFQMKLAQMLVLLSASQMEKFVPQKAKELFRTECFRLQMLFVQRMGKNQN